MPAPMMPTVKGKDTDEARLRWYADAPVCPVCDEHRVSVGQARIGFFGLSLTYFDRCDSCLPSEVAEYSRQVRANLLGAPDREAAS